MVPGPSIDRRPGALGAAEGKRLLDIAVLGVRHAAEARPAPALDLTCEPPALLSPGASFVTLKHAGRLRGCIGSLEPLRPLVEDVMANAYAAARHDPRFPELQVWELSGLQLSVSTLGPHEPITAATREALLLALRPGVDGLVVRSGTRRATFLPAVWEQLPEPADFVDALWQKARLAPGSWPEQLELTRYHVETLETRL